MADMEIDREALEEYGKEMLEEFHTWDQAKKHKFNPDPLLRTFNEGAE